MEPQFIVLLIFSCLELYLSGTWQNFYFTMGIPIFMRSTALATAPDLSVHVLQLWFPGGWLYPLRFKKVAHNQVAFREALWYFDWPLYKYLHYPPVMHGLIRYDERMKELQVVGYMNVFPPVFLLLFIMSGAEIFAFDEEMHLVLTAFIVGLWGLSFFVQFKRYDGVYKSLSVQNKIHKGLRPPPPKM